MLPCPILAQRGTGTLSGANQRALQGSNGCYLSRCREDACSGSGWFFCPWSTPRQRGTLIAGAAGLAYPFPPSPARLFTQPLPKPHLRQRLCAKPQVPLVKSPAAWQPIPVRPRRARHSACAPCAVSTRVLLPGVPKSLIGRAEARRGRISQILREPGAAGGLPSHFAAARTARGPL